MKTFKKILKWSTAVFALLVIILVAHIYMVTRPKVAGPDTIAMARIDIKQEMNDADANSYAKWLYAQNGVDHVMCNKVGHNITFTYYPVKNNADNLAAALRSNFNINAHRYVPTEEEMMSGCPAGANSNSGVYGILTSLFK